MVAPRELIVDGEAEKFGRVNNLEEVGVDGDTGRREEIMRG